MIAENILLGILAKLGLYKPLDHPYRVFNLESKKCESPLEIAFWNVGYFELSQFGDFAPQIPFGPYRLDFALTNIPEAPTLKIAIEIDGYDYHKSKEQRNNDTRRDRYLMRNGWQVIRFTGSQIHENTADCVQEAVGLVKEYISWLGYFGS